MALLAGPTGALILIVSFHAAKIATLIVTPKYLQEKVRDFLFFEKNTVSLHHRNLKPT